MSFAINDLVWVETSPETINPAFVSQLKKETIVCSVFSRHGASLRREFHSSAVGVWDLRTPEQVLEQTPSRLVEDLAAACAKAKKWKHEVGLKFPQRIELRAGSKISFWDPLLVMTPSSWRENVTVLQVYANVDSSDKVDPGFASDDDFEVSSLLKAKKASRPPNSAASPFSNFEFPLRLSSMHSLPRTLHVCVFSESGQTNSPMMPIDCYWLRESICYDVATDLRTQTNSLASAWSRASRNDALTSSLLNPALLSSSTVVRPSSASTSSTSNSTSAASLSFRSVNETSRALKRTGSSAFSSLALNTSALDDHFDSHPHSHSMANSRRSDKAGTTGTASVSALSSVSSASASFADAAPRSSLLRGTLNQRQRQAPAARLRGDDDHEGDNRESENGIREEPRSGQHRSGHRSGYQHLLADVDDGDDGHDDDDALLAQSVWALPSKTRRLVGAIASVPGEAAAASPSDATTVRRPGLLKATSSGDDSLGNARHFVSSSDSTLNSLTDSIVNSVNSESQRGHYPCEAEAGVGACVLCARSTAVACVKCTVRLCVADCYARHMKQFGL